MSLLMAGAFAHRRSLVDQVRHGDSPGLTALRDSDHLATAAAGWAVVVGIAVFVVLIVFLFRASKNTDLWNRDTPRWGPGWTIGGWFIPFASFVIPGLVTAEVWRRTPQPRLDGSSEPVSTAGVWWWWFAWNVGIVILRLATAIGEDGSPSDAMLSDGIRIVASLVLAAAAILLLVVVRRLSRRQEGLEAARLRAPAPASPWASPV